MLRIFGHFLPTSTVLLGLAETLLLGVAVYLLVLPFSVLYAAPATVDVTTARFALTLATVATVAMGAVGLYGRDALDNYRLITVRIVLAFTIVAPAAFLVVAFFKDHAAAGIHVWWLWYLRAAFVWFICVLVTRAVFSMVTDGNAFKRRVLIVGTGERARRIKDGADRGIRYVPVAFVNACNDQCQVAPSEFRLDGLSDGEALAEYALRIGAEEIVVATDDRRGLPVQQLLHCKLRGLHVTDYLSFWERENGKVNLDALQPSWLVFSDGFRAGWFVDFAKRAFDVWVSAGLLVLTAPLLMVTAIAIKFESPGPVLYRQERVGHRGKTFMVLKFRSMRADAERDGAPQWAAQRDPRVTRVGTVIRKIRVDELPQLINVLRGDMSFIGPRPERPIFVEQLAAVIPYYRERHSVKPGISGWAQVNYPYGASIEDAREKLAYDLYYVKNRTIFLDILILLQTVRVVLFSEGAR